MPKNRVDLTLKQKAQLLKELESDGSSQKAIADKFGVSAACVCRLVKQKAVIQQQIDNGKSSVRKRTRGGRDEDIDEALFIWVKQKCAQGAHLSGPEIQAKAKRIASVKGNDSFQASSGWLWRWKSRFNIKFKRQQGEKQDADNDAANDWIRETLPKILSEFKDDDIFNADETGLYYRAVSDKGHCLANTELSGGKTAKERITALLCANMSGNERRPLLVLGKSRRPRCFPKDVSKLPCDYEHSTKAWMTCAIFTSWMKKWDRKLRLTGRRVCLLVDNCSAHVSTDLTNISLHFLPPNVTSLIQPMDQGVIRNWKGHYRLALNDRIVTELDVDENHRAQTVARSISLLDAVYIANESWKQVKQQTIQNCFKKAGFRREEPVNNECEIDSLASDALHDVAVPRNMTPDEFVDFVSFDDDIVIAGEFDDEDLLHEAQQKKCRLDEDSKDESDEDDDVQMGLMNNKERMQFVSLFRRFIQEEGIDFGKPISFQQVERTVKESAIKGLKQQTIDSFC